VSTLKIGPEGKQLFIYNYKPLRYENFDTVNLDQATANNELGNINLRSKHVQSVIKDGVAR